MSPTAGNGSSRPQTWSARLMGAFTGPGRLGRAPSAKTDPARSSPRGAQGGHVHPGPDRGQVDPGRFVLATVAGIAIPAYFIAENKVTKAGKNSIAVAPDAKLLGGVILLSLRHRVPGPVEAEAHARGLRPLPRRLRVHALHRAHRVRLHPPRWLAHAAGLAHQQVRHDQCQGDRPGGRGAARGRQRKEAARSASKTAVEPGCAQSRRPRASATRRRRHLGRRSPKPTE